jgi:transcriptional regulator with XRE-family HTH domain
MDNIKIGSFIAECRKEKQITQQQLADKLKITNKAVSKWETGNGFPDISLLPELAEILNVSVDEILKAQKNEITIPKVDGPDLERITNTEKAMSQNTDAVLSYLVHKSIDKFKLMSILSILLSIVGIVIQYFIWRETNNLTGWIFGLWLEICSGGIFYYYRTLMNTQINDYNTVVEIKLNAKHISKQFSNCLYIIWVLMLLTLICYFI